MEPWTSTTVTIFVTSPFADFRHFFHCDRKSQLVRIRLEVLDRQMRVPAHHRFRLPAPQFLKHPSGHVILPEPRRPGVPQIVPAEVFNPHLS